MGIFLARPNLAKVQVVQVVMKNKKIGEIKHIGLYLKM